MARAVLIGIVVCCLVKYTFAGLSCYNNNSISICSDGRRQGSNVNVDFLSAPLYEINVSCSCFIFAQSDTEILTSYETSSDSDIILVNTSIRLGDQTFQEATRGFIKLSAHSFKKLHFNGDIGSTSPGVCLTFTSSFMINIEVVCLPKNDKTVPISGFSTQALSTEEQPTSSTAEQSTSTIPEQSTSSKAEHPTPSTTEQSTSNTAEQTTAGAAGQPTSTAEVSQHERQPRRINYTIIVVAVGGGIGIVVVVVIVVAVVIFRRRRLSTRTIKKQTTTDTTDSQRDNDETHNYVNTLQISAGEHNQTSENANYEVLSSNRCEAIYDQPILNITSGV